MARLSKITKKKTNNLALDNKNQTFFRGNPGQKEEDFQSDKNGPNKPTRIASASSITAPEFLISSCESRI